MDPASTDRKLQDITRNSHDRRRGHHGRPNPAHQNHGPRQNYQISNFNNQDHFNRSHQTQSNSHQNLQVAQVQPLSQPTIIQNRWKRWSPETRQYSFLDNTDYQGHMMKAIEDGCSVYIGNMEWSIEPPDVAIWLEGGGFTIKAVTMPEVKKRGHFCQVEFNSREDSNAAVINLDMQKMRGRSVKMNLNEPDAYTEKRDVLKGGNKTTSTRLWVGGFPHTTNINPLEDYIKELFHGFHIESLSNIHTSKGQSSNGDPNTYYCFVDLPNTVEARTAIRILNNRETSWGIARVGWASESSQGILEYRGINDENRALCE
ncbi:uncharacterized protein DFL_009880 [Arthrobotrys flagrans]|uniref:RRM domain-containing protein n=1 Tax=Arthrobotrys flagrans TaxID=97331 RepID=A0A436ZSW2_ARTFL|nr:hypothetical protein DFL_009880 [Arthrobotrys flagrans]